MNAKLSTPTQKKPVSKADGSNAVACKIYTMPGKYQATPEPFTLKSCLKRYFTLLRKGFSA